MLALVLVAISLGLNNLAAAVAIGVGGVDGGTRLRVGLVFGVFEAGMPAIGLLIGRGLATTAGQAARWPGAALLVAAGGYALVRTLRERRRGGTAGAGRVPGAGGSGTGTAGAMTGDYAGGGGAGTARGMTGDYAGDADWRKRTAVLLLSGLALSADNLAAGFALGTYRVGLAAGAVVIGSVSVAMSLAGLELGARIGRRAGRSGELVAGFVLIAAGVVIVAGAT